MNGNDPPAPKKKKKRTKLLGRRLLKTEVQSLFRYQSRE